MKEITITIKPTLNDINDPSRMSELLRLVGEVVNNNVDLLLEAVGEEILRRAKANAEQGYMSLPFTGDEAITWAKRDRITERLYSLSPYHAGYSPSGMDTGRRKLIGSLERHGEDNIFDLGIRDIEVGTRFKHASLLEKGGVRKPFPNIGFRSDGSPNRWLVEALQAGLITQEEINEIRSHLFHPQPMEARPFLRPAMRDMRDNGDHLKMVGEVLEKEIELDIRLHQLRIQSQGERYGND